MNFSDPINGWAEDRVVIKQLNYAVVEHELNLFHDAPEILGVCHEHQLASLNRSPLAMGILSGKFHRDSRLPVNDVRGAGFDWVPLFSEGKPRPEYLAQLDAVREILTSDGRTLVQGALAWIWGKSETTIPIPGFKTVQQIEENAGAMAFGPLRPEQMAEIDALLGRSKA